MPLDAKQGAQHRQDQRGHGRGGQHNRSATRPRPRVARSRPWRRSASMPAQEPPSLPDHRAEEDQREGQRPAGGRRGRPIGHELSGDQIGDRGRRHQTAEHFRLAPAVPEGRKKHERQDSDQQPCRRPERHKLPRATPGSAATDQFPAAGDRHVSGRQEQLGHNDRVADEPIDRRPVRIEQPPGLVVLAEEDADDDPNQAQRPQPDPVELERPRIVADRRGLFVAATRPTGVAPARPWSPPRRPA